MYGSVPKYILYRTESKDFMWKIAMSIMHEVSFIFHQLCWMLVGGKMVHVRRKKYIVEQKCGNNHLLALSTFWAFCRPH